VCIAQVLTDVVMQLGLDKNTTLFRQSFNRANLRYQVRRKSKATLSEVSHAIAVVVIVVVVVVVVVAVLDAVQL
jgi:superfamily II DNA helicase RecQ